MEEAAEAASAVEEAASAVEEAKNLIRNKEYLMQLWTNMVVDTNGSNVSLAEIGKMVVELSSAGAEQHIWANFNSKPALIRAYRFTTKQDGRKINDAYVHKNEFAGLLRNLFYFSTLWSIFDDIDIEDDRCVDNAEFKAGLRKLGFELSQEQCRYDFEEMDADDGGMILFDEFCAYCIKISGAEDEAMGIRRIIYDSDSDEEDVKKTKKKKVPVIDRGTIEDYADILGTHIYNEQTGQWCGFTQDNSQPTVQDLQQTITSVKRKAKVDRQETLRLEMGLPPNSF